MTLRVVPPSPPPVGMAWYGLSVVVNALVLAGLVWLAGQRSDPVDPTLIVSEDPDQQIEYLVFLVPAARQNEPGGEGETAAGEETDNQATVLTPVLPEQPEQEEEIVAPPTEVPTEVVALPPDSNTRDPVVVGTRRRLGPTFGTGEMWVPVRLTDRDRALIAVHLADIDSTYRRELLAALQAIPPDSFAMGGAQPWTADINGQTWGIDGQFIHLGSIKIPTVLLALLPIPATGSFDQAVEAREYERMRQEILFHAARQADREQVDDYIQQLREREDEKRRQRRALLARPDTIIAARDTIIPR